MGINFSAISLLRRKERNPKGHKQVRAGAVQARWGERGLNTSPDSYASSTTAGAKRDEQSCAPRSSRGVSRPARGEIYTQAAAKKTREGRVDAAASLVDADLFRHPARSASSPLRTATSPARPGCLPANQRKKNRACLPGRSASSIANPTHGTPCFMGAARTVSCGHEPSPERTMGARTPARPPGTNERKSVEGQEWG